MSEISKLDQNLAIKKIDNETINISINDNEMLMAIVGQFDQNLKSLSKLTNIDVFLYSLCQCSRYYENNLLFQR